MTRPVPRLASLPGALLLAASLWLGLLQSGCVHCDEYPPGTTLTQLKQGPAYRGRPQKGAETRPTS